MYLFYATNLAPFLIIGLALALGQLAGWSIVGDRPVDTSPGLRPAVRRLWLTRTGMLFGVIYLVLAVWMFLFFLPVYSGLPLTQQQWHWRMWLPGWT
jgi:dolichyl-phosphate-mannose--protein O-mannosyl transferase